MFPSHSGPGTMSEMWRIQGNDHFKSYQASTNFMDKKKHLENAIQSYREAHKTAENGNEKCSACKNYGTAAWRLLGILREISMDRHRSEIETRLLEAIEFLGKGLSYGAQLKDADWTDSLTVLYVECVEDATTVQLKDLSYTQKIIALEKYVGVMADDHQRGKCFFKMASAMFIKAIEALASKDYKTALNALHECHRPILECIRLFPGEDRMLSEVNIIQEDVKFQLATAESLQAIDQGNILLKIAVSESESLHMGLIYEAMDWYKKAIILTREVEVEMEACALSHLGHVHDKILKRRSKAKEYFMRCMHLATSLQPRNLQSESWFRTCTEALQRYQQESLVDEEQRKQEERKDFLSELKTEISDLKKADEGFNLGEFLKHIYATYPPKKSDQTLDLSEGPKKVLLKSISHYHPDKQDTDANGMKWEVLCEEITKLMTRRYEAYKFEYKTVENTETKAEEEDKQTSEQDQEEDKQASEQDQEEDEEPTEQGQDEDEEYTEQDHSESTTSPDEDNESPDAEEGWEDLNG